jgi:AmmeMemoRadiSam system protein B
MNGVRRPAVAGFFYPAEPERLRDAVSGLLGAPQDPSDARAVILPHGGFQQCGAVLGAAVSRWRIPRRCILIGPAHTTSWLAWSLMSDGAYQTPLGEVPVDAELAQALAQRCPFLEPAAAAQRGEHAVEVILPFLQLRGPADLRIVPIITSSEQDEEIMALGEALAQAVRLAEEPVGLIASADLSHFQSAAAGGAQDEQLLAALCAVDPASLRRMAREGIAMCGDNAAAAVLEAARRLGATAGQTVAYGTSAQAGGDPDSTTGYAGILIN